MNKLELAGNILNLLARGVQAASEAITAASVEKEDEAFAILYAVLAEGKGKVEVVRAREDASKAAARKALDEKFPGPQPTVLVDPDKVP